MYSHVETVDKTHIYLFHVSKAFWTLLQLTALVTLFVKGVFQLTALVTFL
jgi:hypothetical protein